MRYLDSSLIVTSLVNEPRRGEVQDWLAQQHEASLSISWWTMTEIESAFARKQREGWSAAARRVGEQNLRRLIHDTFAILAVERRHFVRAGEIAGHSEGGLRASDALHLAIADAAGLEAVTLDKRMASGGALAGVRTLLL